jgi:cytochrome c553
MMNMTRWGFVALTALAACTTAAQAAGDAAAGQKKAYTCMGCHGVPGYNNAYPEYHVPKLGGQNADYITSALKEYKSGDRPHPTMHDQALTMSDQDIDDIAAYLSKAPAKKD